MLPQWRVCSLETRIWVWVGGGLYRTATLKVLNKAKLLRYTSVDMTEHYSEYKGQALRLTN